MISRKVDLKGLDESKKYRIGAYSARYVPQVKKKEFQNMNSQNILKVSQDLAKQLDGLDWFEMLNKGERLPIISFRQKKETGFSLQQLSHKLREKGWIVPAYCLPENAGSIEIMRVIVRENFASDMAVILAKDIDEAYKFLISGGKSSAKNPCPNDRGLNLVC